MRAREVVMRMWYVIQVARGSEEAMAELIGRVAPADVLSECFYPQYETEIKLRGTWTRCAKPLFPGYLIAVTDSPVALEEELVKLPEFARVLSMGEKPVPLAAEEVELIGGFTHPGERVVPMSQAVKDGERVVVVAGPLLGHEGLIKEVNRRKSCATLEIDLCGRKVSTRVGLAVLSTPDTVESRAARLRTKAVA
ncbi:antiterminator LoaP [Thermophilibacter provencensis]